MRERAGAPWAVVWWVSGCVIKWFLVCEGLAMDRIGF